MSKNRPVSWRANPLPLWNASLIGEVQLLVLTLLRPGFATRPVYVGLVVERVTLGRIFVRVLWFSAVIVIPPIVIIISYIRLSATLS